MSEKLKKKSINASMSISTEGNAAIAKDEGFSAYPYDDQAKHCTVGTGILLSKAPCTAEQKATKYDVNQLNSTYHARLNEAEGYVRHYVRETKLTQAQYDTLTSYVFNVGVGNAQQALSLANSGKHKDVANEMGQYINVTVKDKNGKKHMQKSNGLINRRERETQPFQTKD